MNHFCFKDCKVVRDGGQFMQNIKLFGQNLETFSQNLERFGQNLQDFN